MQVTTSLNSVNIVGNIKSIQDYQEIRRVLSDLTIKYNEITIVIENSLSITSSIIGFLNKLVLKDGIKITMKVGNSQLMELLEDLSLTSTFNVGKIS